MSSRASRRATSSRPRSSTRCSAPARPPRRARSPRPSPMRPAWRPPRASVLASTSRSPTDANDETGWKYVEATGSGDSPFDFTIDYTMLNGGSVSVGDTIQYFVVAQDTRPTPNVGHLPGIVRRGADQRRSHAGGLPDRRDDQQLHDHHADQRRAERLPQRLRLHVADQRGRTLRDAERPRVHGERDRRHPRRLDGRDGSERPEPVARGPRGELQPDDPARRRCRAHRCPEALPAG